MKINFIESGLNFYKAHRQAVARAKQPIERISDFYCVKMGKGLTEDEFKAVENIKSILANHAEANNAIIEIGHKSSVNNLDVRLSENSTKSNPIHDIKKVMPPPTSSSDAYLVSEQLEKRILNAVDDATKEFNIKMKNHSQSIRQAEWLARHNY